MSFFVDDMEVSDDEGFIVGDVEVTNTVV